MNIKETKIKEIQKMINLSKPFITHDYPNLEIYSKQYYKKIISKLFNGDKNYSYIYFDVDGLNMLNNTCGKRLADIALKYLLTIIKKSVPNNALMNRIAGDEFCIILPNTDIEETKKIEKNIHANIDFLSTFVYGLTITSAIESSNMYSSIEAIEQETETECSRLKQIKKNQLIPHQNEQVLQRLNQLSIDIYEDYDSNGNNVWETLNLLIQNAVKNHLKDLRPSADFYFENEDIKEQSFYIISIINNLMENNESDIIPLDFDKEDELFYTIEGIEVIDIDPTTVKQIHSLFTGDQDFLDSLDEKTILHLYDYIAVLSDELVRDPHSGLLTKSYLNSYLAEKICNSSKDYQAIYISDIRYTFF